MQVFRDSFTKNNSNIIPASPVRELYGKKMFNGKEILIAPLDLILYVRSNNNDSFQPPSVAGYFLGATVRTSSREIGRISKYDYPPTKDFFDIKPFILIEPFDSVDISDIPDIKVSSIPPLNQDQKVTLRLPSGSSISGELVSDTVVSRSYPDASSQVKGYRIKGFNQSFIKEIIGARVFVGDELLGMLINIQNQTDGTYLVFPAHQI